MKRVLTRGSVLLVALLATQAMTSPSQHFDPPTYNKDPRLLILKRFFEERDSPLPYLARDFLIAADRHNLDWRLLPSISIVESGGGKVFRNNNIFGWDNCRRAFPSVKDGIHVVASRLAKSNLYRNKDLDGKLATYNPNAQYPGLIKSVMARLGPDELPVPSTLDCKPEDYSSIRTPK